MFLFKQFMSTLPGELTQAARVDGASKWTIFSRIIMPMARPVLAVMFLLDFVAAWNDYFWPYLVTNSPDDDAAGRADFADGRRSRRDAAGRLWCDDGGAASCAACRW